MRMDALHYALLAVVVLLVVYCGASFLREVETAKGEDSPNGEYANEVIGEEEDEEEDA